MMRLDYRSRRLLNAARGFQRRRGVFDSFKRPNAAASLGYPDYQPLPQDGTGGYSVVVGTLEIYNNQVRPLANAVTSTAVIESGTADVLVEAEVDSVAANLAGDTHRIIARYRDINNYWLLQQGNGSGIYLGRFLGGSYSNMASLAGLNLPRPTLLSLLLHKRWFVAFANGVQLFSYEDTTGHNIADTRHGFAIYGSAAQGYTGRLNRFSALPWARLAA